MNTRAPKQKSIYYDLQAGVKPREIASAEHPATVKKAPKAHNAVKNIGNEAGSEEKPPSTGLPT